MGFENLSDVHARRHAERVEHDVHRAAVRHERHVFFGDDTRHDTLIAVTSGHFVADRDFALLGQIHLDQLDHARRELIGLQNAVDALFGALFDTGLLFVRGVDDLAHPIVGLLAFDAERLEVERGETQPVQAVAREGGAGGDRLFHRTGLEGQRDGLAGQQCGQFHVAHFVDADLLLALESTHVTDALTTILFHDLIFDAREDLHVDDHALHTGRHLQRAVLHVLGFFAEDRGEELFFRRELGFTLRRDLADEDVTRLHLGADTHDATLVEIDQRLLGDVGNFTRDFFLTTLRVAHVQFEFLDVNRREDVELHQALGEHDRVFEVVAIPGHERHGHVGPERELPHFGGGTVGQHFALGHRLPHAHERALVDGGVLVGAPVLLESVAIEMAESGQRAIGVDRADLTGIDDDLIGRYAGHSTRSTRDDDGARVDGHRRFETGPNERRARIEQGDGLTLHVRAHQRAVGVVVLEERNERGGDRHELFRGHVHVVDVGWRREREVTTLTRQHEIIDERAVGIELGIGLRDDRVFFAIRVEPHDFTGDPAVLHHAVRGLDEAEIVHAGVAGERRDQTDVRAFRRLDGAHATVLRVVHVSHFEAGPLAREATRSEGRQTTLVRQLAERIGLVHELRELRRTEERLNDGRHGTRIHEIVERDLFGIGVDRHALLDQSRHTRQTNGELVGDQLTHRADTAISQLIDIVHIAAAFVEFHELAHDLNEVFLREDGGRHRRVEPQTLVDFIATDTTEVVALGREEQTLERLLGRLAVGRVARTEERVDLLERFLLVLRRVLGQGVLDQRRLGTAGGDEDLDLGQVGLPDPLDDGIDEDGALVGDDLTGVGIDDVARQRAAHFTLAAVDRVLFVA